jgi:hypothetical protein
VLYCRGVVTGAREEGRVRGVIEDGGAWEADRGGVVGADGEARCTGLRVIWRRRKGSLGSVSEDLRERVVSADILWPPSGLGGGGRREESRIGGSVSCVTELR